MTASEIHHPPGFTDWPADRVADFQRLGYWSGVSLFAAIAESAARRPDDLAVVDERRRVTYAELIAESSQLAGGLAALGFAPGDRVVLQLPNCVDFVTLSLACFRIGVLPIMALPAHREHELGYLLEFSKARGLMIADRFRDFDFQAMAAKLKASAPDLEHVLVSRLDGQPDIVEGFTDLVDLRGADHKDPVDLSPVSRSVALFLLSGGTTGLPKLIPRTHDDYLYNARTAASLCHISASTRYLVALPAGHNFPLACPGIIGTLLEGGRVIMAPSPAPEAAFELIAREGATVTAVVPAVALQWLNSPALKDFDLDSLEVLQVGGSVFPAEVAARVRPELGATVQQAFGMAEGLINLTRLDDTEDAIVNTQGRPMSEADEIRVVDPQGNDVAAGESGELLTRGPYTLQGYFDAPEHNARSFTADGFYRSGDLVRVREDGNLTVEGRDKDLINRGGEKISAEELENLMLAHPNVYNAAAVAMPDEKLGERICVYIVTQSGSVDLDTLREFLDAKGIARFKLPEKLVVVDQLPQTSVGKIDKKALRDDIVARLAS